MWRLRLAGVGLACALSAGAGLGAACASAPATADAASVKNGIWGAEGVSLTVTSDGGAIEYDCGHGTIDKVMALDGAGKFDVTGAHFSEGGPTRQGDSGAPARYRGTVTGDRLSLTVTVTSSDTTLGQFTLTFGQQAVLTKCK